MSKVIKIFSKGQNSLSINIDLKRLTALQETLGKKYETRVGVLSDYSARATLTRNNTGKAKITSNETLSDKSNAEIGWIHEFGSYSRGIPERSFLRFPLALYLRDAVNQASGRINKALQNSDMEKSYALLGLAAEKVVQEAFATGGFGHWQKLKDSTIARKGSNAILIDTAQLRKSIHSKVVTI